MCFVIIPEPVAPKFWPHALKYAMRFVPKRWSRDDSTSTTPAGTREPGDAPSDTQESEPIGEAQDDGVTRE